MGHEIEYSRDAATQVAALSGRQRASVLDGVEKHLEVIETKVVVHAVGIKKGNIVRIGGEVMEL